MKFAKVVKYKRFTPFAVECAALYLALFFIATAVSQLFAFEDFPQLIANYSLPIFTDDWSLVLASIIVVLEIAAIPYLLSMKQSRLAHVLSHMAGWVVLLFWLGTSIWLSLSDVATVNSGFLGAKIIVPTGWWLVTYIVILVVLFGFIDMRTSPVRHSGKKQHNSKKKIKTPRGSFN